MNGGSSCFRLSGDLLYSTNILAAVPGFFLATNYPFFHPMRIFVYPYDTGELWATSMGNGLRVGWLTEPRPVFDRVTVDSGAVRYTGWSSDSQRLQIQTSSNLADWSDIAINTVSGGRFGGTDTAGGGGARFYRAAVASPLTGCSP